MNKEDIEELLRKNGLNAAVISISSLAGGSISEAREVKTNKGSFFLKFNDYSQGLAMFQAEADGLKRLNETECITVPEVITLGKIRDRSYIILDFLRKGNPTAESRTDFGRSLAAMHRYSYEKYGLSNDNYIASLEQNNTYSESWTEFFISQRLEALLRIATDDGLADYSCTLKFSRLFLKLESLLPREKPALLHGDLWNGNFMFTEQGRVAVFDPAVYYGHREMDIAMTTLFGGFGQEFYNSYNESFQLEKGWEERLDIHNLYPLLVHLVLFGRSYLPDIMRILSRFT